MCDWKTYEIHISSVNRSTTGSFTVRFNKGYYISYSCMHHAVSCIIMLCSTLYHVLCTTLYRAFMMERFQYPVGSNFFIISFFLCARVILIQSLLLSKLPISHVLHSTFCITLKIIVAWYSASSLPFLLQNSPVLSYSFTFNFANLHSTKITMNHSELQMILFISINFYKRNKEILNFALIIIWLSVQNNRARVLL